MAASDFEEHSPLFRYHHNSQCEENSACHYIPSSTITRKADFTYPSDKPPSTLARIFRSWHAKAVLTMVAIPTYLLASAAYSSIASLLQHPPSLPIPEHNVTQQPVSAFATVKGPVMSLATFLILPSSMWMASPTHSPRTTAVLARVVREYP